MNGHWVNPPFQFYKRNMFICAKPPILIENSKLCRKYFYFQAVLEKVQFRFHTQNVCVTILIGIERKIDVVFFPLGINENIFCFKDFGKSLISRPESQR